MNPLRTQSVFLFIFSKRLLFILVTGLIINPKPGKTNGVQSKQIYIGYSRQEITPPKGTPLSGYGRRRGKPSQGIEDPVFARAIRISKGDDFFIFACLDLTLIDRNFRSSVFRKVNKKIPVKQEQLVLFATHTHSGPGGIGKKFWQKFIMGKFNKSLFESITDKVAQTIIDASEKKILVRVKTGETRIDKFVTNRMDENLKYPARLKTLQFYMQNRVLARLVFLSAHPTILSSSNFHFSGDFPGIFMNLLETNSPGSIALFVNGAAGDLKPRVEEERDEIQAMKSFAKSLFTEFKTIQLKETNLVGPWGGKYKKLKLPSVKIRWKNVTIPVMIGKRLFPKQTVLHVIRMGNLMFPAVPAELASEVGQAIEDQIRSREIYPFLIGYANDYIGYVIPRRYYLNQKFYEARASFYGPKIDWFLQREVEALLDQLLTDQEIKKLTAPGTISYRSDLPVLKLSGTPYHRGFEEGRLLRNEIREIYSQINQYLKSHLPIPGINQLIINRYLDRTWKKLEPFVNYSEFRQLQGLADSSGVPLKDILRIHAIPEVFPTGCSNGAYWGPATKDGGMIAIRTLDWNRDMGVQNAAAVKFHKMQGKLNYANLGYYGFIGVLSGINEEGISVGQIGATSRDEAADGIPMPFLLKRILTEATSLKDSISLFEQTRRTQGFNYIIADALDKKAVAIESTHNHLSIFYDNDPQERSVNYSFPIANAVFRGDPAMDPNIRNLQWASNGNPDKPGIEFPSGEAYSTRYLKHGMLIQKNRGQIDPQIAKSIAREISPASNIQSVVYAFPDFWVANAKNDLRATDCHYHHFNFQRMNK